MIQVKFKKEHPEATLPQKAHKSDAGFDVVSVSCQNVFSEDGEKYIEYDLGFSTEIPEGYKGVIVPRSSISKYDLIMCNSPAQIDPSYRGTWRIRFKLVNSNSNSKARIYSPLKDRIAQIFFEPIIDAVFIESEELSSTQRGDGGFGSTNK